MNPLDPLDLRSPKPEKAQTGFVAALKNVGMFTLALVVTITVVTLFKSATASASGNHAGTRYYLQATSAIRAGDVLSPDNTAWRSSIGKNTRTLLTDDTKTSDRYWGWRALMPIRGGQPVPVGSVIQMSQAETELPLPPDSVGFVLTGDEVVSAAEMLRQGSHVNVIAVAGGNRKMRDLSPSVATLVEGATVLRVRPGLKRGGRGMDASVTIAVSPDEAEDLAAWRQNGSLIVALAGKPLGSESRAGNWRELLSDSGDNGDKSDDLAEAAAPPTAQVAPAATPSVAVGPRVTVVTASGAQDKDVPAAPRAKVGASLSKSSTPADSPGMVKVSYFDSESGALQVAAFDGSAPETVLQATADQHEAAPGPRLALASQEVDLPATLRGATQIIEGSR